MATRRLGAADRAGSSPPQQPQQPALGTAGTVAVGSVAVARRDRAVGVAVRVGAGRARVGGDQLRVRQLGEAARRVAQEARGVTGLDYASAVEDVDRIG